LLRQILIAATRRRMAYTPFAASQRARRDTVNMIVGELENGSRQTNQRKWARNRGGNESAGHQRGRRIAGLLKAKKTFPPAAGPEEGAAESLPGADMRASGPFDRSR